MSTSTPLAPDAGGQFIVDDASAYEALMALRGLAQPQSLGRGPWRDWAEATAGALQLEQWRLVRKWFAETMVGPALVALVPLLKGTRDLADLANTWESLPPGDVARTAVTSELIAPQTPLDADGLLAMRGDIEAARRFCELYIRVSGRRRVALAHVLVAPEEARAELADTLRMPSVVAALAALEPQAREERERALTALRAQALHDGGAIPSFIRGRDNLQGFSPVVVGVSTLLGDEQFVYYHDVDRTLIDGRAYEPFIAVGGTRRALGLARRRRRGAADSSGALTDPVARWAAVYTALADPSRLRIVQLLVEQPRYGQELAAALGMSGATISHHLNALSKAGVLGVERRAHRTYFVLDAAALRALLREGEQFALGKPDAREGMV